VPVRLEVKGWIGRVVARLDISRLSSGAGGNLHGASARE
jgi:hypothetical protein